MLGTDFTLTPVIQMLKVNGFSTVVPSKVHIMGPTNLALGVRFDGELSLSATLTFEFAQLNHKWWHICWTNNFKPTNCPPAIVNLDAAIGLLKPTLLGNILLSMVQCSPSAPVGTCQDLSLSDIVTVALTRDVNALLARFMRRCKELAVTDLTLGFDQITQLNFHFHESGLIIKELAKKLLAFSTKELDKKGDMYKALIGVSNKLTTTMINKVINESSAQALEARAMMPKLNKSSSSGGLLWMS